MNAPARSLLSEFIDVHHSELLQFVEPKQFSRSTQKLSLLDLVKFLLFTSCAGNHNGFDIGARRFFASEEDHVNRSSFCKARQKIRWEAFEYLLSVLNREDRSNQGKWHGHNVRAIGGTRLVLPRSNETLDFFPCNKPSRGSQMEHYPRARLLVAANVFTQQITHAVVGPALELIKQLPPANDIILLDRGFEGALLWRAIAESGNNFVARIRCSDVWQEKFLSGQLLKTAHAQILVECSGQRIRLLRGPRRKDGSCIVLATNLLDQTTYSSKDLIALYKQRWEVEKVFLHLKQIFHLEHFHSRKLNGVLQEIYAALVMQSWVAGWIDQAAGIGSQSDQEKIINFKAAAQTLAEFLPRLLGRYRSKRLVDLVLEKIAAIRYRRQKNRSYPRVSQQPQNRWAQNKNPNYYAMVKYRPDPIKWWRTKSK